MKPGSGCFRGNAPIDEMLISGVSLHPANVDQQQRHAQMHRRAGMPGEHGDG